MSYSASENEKGILLETGTNEVEFLEFSLGKLLCGVNVAKVRQVLVFDPKILSPIPGAKRKGVIGTVLFRDEPILVVNLGVFLDVAPASECNDSRRLLLALEFNQRVTAFVVEEVDKIHRVSWDEFEIGKNSGVVAKDTWVTGTVTIAEQIMMILDFEAILGKIVPSSSIEAYSEPNTDLHINKDLKIVYCEDSEIVQKVALKALRNAGFSNIKIFPTGLHGLNYLNEAGPDAVDIVMTDIEMPKMDGHAFCRRLKEDVRFADTPVIFFSSTINDEMRRKCKAVGGAGSFAKPEIQELIGSFSELIRR